MNKHTPSPRRPEDTPPIRTQADLEEHWRALMGPLGFGTRSIWMQILDDENRCTPVLMQIEELPRVPGEDDTDGMRRLLEHFREDGGSVAFLVTRPGRAGMSSSDRAWATSLTDAVRRAGLRPWPVHRANDQELAVCSADDLAA